MTSNIGSELIREKFEDLREDNRQEVVENTQRMVFEMLKQSLRPEFLNRIDEVIVFQPLDAADLRKIVELQLQYVRTVLHKQEITLEVTPQAIDLLAQEGFDPQFGARPIKRVIQKRVLNEISKQILLNKIEPKTTIVMDAFDDAVVFRPPLEKELATENIE